MKLSKIDLNWQEVVVILAAMVFIVAFIDPGVLRIVADFVADVAAYINPFAGE